MLKISIALRQVSIKFQLYRRNCSGLLKHIMMIILQILFSKNLIYQKKVATKFP